MTSIKAQITFNEEEECLICKRITKVVYCVAAKDACYCGDCFGELYHDASVIMNQDCDDVISKSTDDYMREYLENTLKIEKKINLNLNAVKSWCNKDKESKTIDSAIDFLGGMIESFGKRIESLESEINNSISINEAMTRGENE